jgi:hypothetical protein
MNIHALVIFLGIVMISSTIGISSSDALLPENLPEVSHAPDHVRVIEGENIIAYARALLTTVDDPNNHLTPIGDPYDGVPRLLLPNSDGNTYLCSGALLPTGQHVLTAAHCVTDLFGNDALLGGGTATFAGDSGSEIINIIDFEVHPLYDGDFIKGNDIAILILENAASGDIVRYNYDISGDAVGQVVTKVGYGFGGYFSLGWDGNNYPLDIKRDGINEYDAHADVMYQSLGLNANSDYVPEAIYQYDSDNNNSSNDAFGFFLGISDSGQGINEVISAPGDSGGPSLVDTTDDGIPDTVVGISSYGITLEYTRGPFPRTSDCTTTGIGPGGDSPILDSSCGEFAGDTKVSRYSDFIVSVLTPDVDPPVISAINAVASSTTATITWTTDEPAISLIEYGTTDTYDSIILLDSNYVTSHSIELTGLELSTVYHFSVTSQDNSGNSESSGDDTFLTTAPPSLGSITVTPADTSIEMGSDQLFAATGHYSDGSIADITDSVTWSSSDPVVASIDANGLATGQTAGSTTITASGSVSGDTPLTVTNPPEPSNLSITSIVPSSVSKGYSGNIGIFGTGFDETAQISFANGDGPVPKITNIVFVGFGELTVTIDVKSGGPPRSTSWDVIITLSNGDSTVSPVPLTINP